MFTGIIEEIGTVKEIESSKISVDCNEVLNGTKLGDSISVNGVCLTVTDIGVDFFTANVSPETIKVTILGNLKSGAKVNLERALTLSTRIGGHIVTGHIDTTAKVDELKKNGNFYNLTVRFDSSFSKYTVKKGSIAINGTSLTIADCGDNIVTIAIIPSTFDNTNLKYVSVGDIVNIEFDILSKYVEKFLSSSNNNNITVNYLAENGFC